MPASVARETSIEFRPLARSDFDLLYGWLNEPEIVRWYSDGRPTPKGIRRKYEPRIAGTSGTCVHVVLLDGVDAGLCQTYRFDVYLEYATQLGVEADWAGLDYFIGEPRYRGLGLAHRIIDAFVREHIFGRWADAGACVSSTDPANVRSIRALERAGFEFLRDVWTSSTSLEHLLIRRR
jgi:aminoglycoside 6'-N-acetyltransferase